MIWPLIMGIVNASPESFSDGGRWATLDDQVARALEHPLLEVRLADVVDGGLCLSAH
jgi:dihydropteroate synthase